MALERTFAIIKPDAVGKGQSGEILSMIEQAGFRVVGMKLRRLSKQDAEAFYAVHRERPFFPGLVTFMTEGPVVTLVLERENAITKWRDLMGATNPANAAEGRSASALPRASSAIACMDRMRWKRPRSKFPFSSAPRNCCDASFSSIG